MLIVKLHINKMHLVGYNIVYFQLCLKICLLVSYIRRIFVRSW